jgi:hypothetical protein
MVDQAESMTEGYSNKKDSWDNYWKKNKTRKPMI